MWLDVHTRPWKELYQVEGAHVTLLKSNVDEVRVVFSKREWLKGGRVKTLNTSKGSRSLTTFVLSKQSAAPFLNPQRHASDNVRLEWTKSKINHLILETPVVFRSASTFGVSRSLCRVRGLSNREGNLDAWLNCAFSEHRTN